MRCTVDDIAKAACVHRATVLRALLNKPDISPETRERIRKLAKEMKYRPNFLARSLKRGRSHLVGVVVNPSFYYSSHLIIESIGRALRSAGYSMLLYIMRPDAGVDESLLEELMTNCVEGVIAVVGSREVDNDVYGELLDSGVRLVVCDGYLEGMDVPQVVGDNYKAGRLSAEYLISLGHRRITYIGIPLTSKVGRDRARGFSDAMKEAGIPITEGTIIEADFNEGAAEQTAQMLMARQEPPTALFVRHDVVARGIMRGLLKGGFSVPEDVSVVGCGNIPGSDMFRVPLTTIHFPVEQMTEISVQTLLSMLAGEEVDFSVRLLDVHMVIRDSVSPPRLK
ncbi:MAG: LacI family DNA-binding transcriptional regulator [Armatimonadota bacterium]